jgi:hypothetical protein
MKYLIISIILLSSLKSFSQKSVNPANSLEVWKLLRSLKYESKENGIYQPFFSPAIQSLDGKKVTLEGFMIVIQHERKPKYFMISFFPVNSCFFCGAAGPETVVEVFSEKPVTYTDDPIVMSGVLRLNAKDENKMFYILEKAEQSE